MLVVFILLQSRLMELCGRGDMVFLEDLELMIQPLDKHQLPHLLVELTGNKLVQEMLTLLQLRLMVLYGHGVKILEETLELLIQSTDLLQLLHLLVVLTGNK